MSHVDLTRIIYWTDKHYVLRVDKGYEVYANGTTAATRVARIGYDGDKGLHRAMDEITRREAGS